MFPELSKALDLPEDATEEDVGITLLAVTTSATQDEKPHMSLSEVYQLINECNATSMLNPLDTLSVLLPSKDPASKYILRALGKSSPAKEVVMAVQEALERLEHSEIHTDDNEESSSPQSQLIILIDIFALAIPRLTLRRKTASETLKPLMSDLGKAVHAHGDAFSINQGRSAIQRISDLVQVVSGWAKSVTESSEEQSSCNKILVDVLLNSLEACAHCIHSCAGMRAFSMYYSRLVVDGSLATDWEDGEKAVQNALEAVRNLGFQPHALTSKPSIGLIILLAHMGSQTLPTSSKLLEKLLPAMLSAFQSCSALDECLAILLHLLPNLKESTISPGVITPLCTILSSVASTHPDPEVRHQCFRVLSLLLSHSPPKLRLEALKELTTDSHLPQMRTAAVGLVKEFVLEGLASSSQNLFASRIVVQVFAPILFRPNPPDFFSKDFSPDEMCDSYEASRLIECLSFYYVLLQRDEANKTGIRDHDIVVNIERSFLAPLRGALSRWTDKDPNAVSMPLISLQISVERVDDAIAALARPV